MPTNLESKILNLRGERVVLDYDLAELYGVTTKRLNEQVRRNSDRFPEDFMFKLNNQELTILKSQSATSRSHGGRRSLPLAFTEHGVVMAANVLNSKVAIHASIMLVRAFVQMRMLVAEYADLKRRLQELEIKLAKGFAAHEEELREIRFMISSLEATNKAGKKRVLGFRSERD